MSAESNNMSFKIESSNGPETPSPTGARAEVQTSARERAIAALMSNNSAPQTAPVLNPTSMSPEEYTAVRAKSAPPAIEPSGQENKVVEEPSAEPVAESKVSEEPLSSQYAILARKEKAIRQREQQIKSREAAIKASEEAAKAKPPTSSIDESKYVPRDRLTSDPFTVLNELGLTYDQLTEMAMNAPKPEQMAIMNEMKALKAEIAALKGESASTRKSFEEQQAAQKSQTINQIKSEVTSLVRNNPDYETVAATGSIGDVVELIEKTFESDGILLSVEEATQQVEEYLVEEALKIARLKKIQHRLQPKTAPVEKATEVPKQQQIKTLTNSVTSSRQLSAKERAILAFQGKLNK